MRKLAMLLAASVVMMAGTAFPASADCGSDCVDKCTSNSSGEQDPGAYDRCMSPCLAKCLAEDAPAVPDVPAPTPVEPSDDNKS